MLTTWILIVFVSHALLMAQTPQKCDVMSTYYSYVCNKPECGTEYNFAVSFNFIAMNDSEHGYFSLTNIVTTGMASSGMNEICVFHDTIKKSCISDFSTNLKVYFEPAALWVNFYFTDNSKFPIYLLFTVEGNSFSFQSGLFSDITPCYNYEDNDMGVTVKQCCTSFKPAPVVSISSPRCNTFKSRTTVYNVDDNYKIAFTSQLYFTISGNEVEISGSAVGISYFAMYVYINEDGIVCEFVNGHMDSCSLDLPATNNVKLFFEFELINGPDDNGIQLVAGFIIIRNDQMLMEEGVPFTPTDNCQYLSQTYTENQVASGSFCCTSFD